MLYFAIAIVFTLVLSHSLWRLFHSKKISRWKTELSLQKHLHIHEQLYAQINGFHLSQLARQFNDAPEYVYGEIEFLAFVALLSLVHPSNNTVFYDLGSGTGKAVLACAMVFPVRKSCGIELFSNLHNAAVLQQKKLAAQCSYKDKASRIQFIKGNFLTTDIQDATLIFVNASGFFGETWQNITDHISQAKHCNTIITTSKKLLSSNFRVIKETKVMMSWGVVSAYIHQRFPQI